MARNVIRLVVLLLLLGLLIGGSWYWAARPANVQAVISEARDASNLPHVMTVEAISEGGASVVGRNVSIRDARVTRVTGTRTFWVEGDEGEPLLIVLAPERGAGLKLSAGARVSLNGVVRDKASKFALSAEDQAQVAKSNLHVLATEVRRVH